MNPFSENKILAHLPIVGQYISGGTYPPIQVEIDLTNHCTSACPWCAGFLDREEHPFILFGKGLDIKEQWESSYKKVCQLLIDLHEYGVKSITWTGGGDPSVHPYLSSLIAKSHTLGMDNGLITNGVIDVSACLSYCTWIRFSVDAATEEGYHKQHGRRHHFKKVLHNIRTVSAIKEREGLDVTLGVGFVTSPDMLDEIVPFAALWKYISVDYIQYRPIMSNYGRHYESDNDQILTRIGIAQQIDARVVKSDAKFNAIEDGASGMTTRCHGTFFETAIAADGLVYVCCHLKGLPQYAIGNLHEESFQSIWEGHLANGKFDTTPDCSTFCRHYGTNKLFEEHILAPRTHLNFI